jgi:DNA-binding transcriptional MocR family regulator
MNHSSSTAELARILRGELDRYSPGERLPANRALVERFRVSPVTVSRALAALAAEGLLVTRPGAGTYRAAAPVRVSAARTGDTGWQEVALSVDRTPPHPSSRPGAHSRSHPHQYHPLPRRTVDASGVLATLAAPPAGVIPFNGGYLHPSLRPVQALSAALARAGRRPDAWERPPTLGLPELRSWFARETGGPGGTVTAAQVLVTAGGQSALNTAMRALAPPGAPVLVESPTYPGVLAIARAAGLKPVPVPVDGEGIRPEHLAEALEASGARLVVCQPLFQNPTGSVLAPARRAEVMRITRDAGAFLIEDDYARRLVHAGAQPLPPPLVADDPDGTVVHVTSLTKATSPSLRVGALVARGPVLERLHAIQVVDSFFVPRPLQEAALDLVGSPAWGRHLRAVASALTIRRDALAGELRRQVPELTPTPLPGTGLPEGGCHLWLRIPEDLADCLTAHAEDGTTADQALTTAARHAGVALAPGHAYFAAEAPAPHVRVSFGDTAGPKELAEGATRVAAAIAAVRCGAVRGEVRVR